MGHLDVRSDDRLDRQAITRRRVIQGATALGLAAPFVHFAPHGLSAQNGGTSVVANYAMPVDLEPGKPPAFMSWFVLQNIGEGLTRLERTAEGELTTQPLLAESYEQSDDGRTWTFTLRPDVVFHDGTALDAEAVLFTHERIMNPDHPQYDPAFALFGDPLNSMVEEITAVDPLTVEFLLHDPPNPYFLNWEAYILIVSPAAVEEFGETFGTNVVGTGPFKLDRFDAAGATIETSRHAEYWQADHPKLEQIVWRAVTEPATRIAMLETGDADVAAIMPPELAPRIEGNPELSLHAANVPTFNAIHFYRAQPPFDDPRLRQAVAHALNREELAQVLYGGYWTAAINNRWPGMPGWEEVEPYPYDPERARALLEEAGMPNLEFTLDMPTSSSANPAGTRWGEVILDQLSQVGITAQLNAVESGSFWTSISTPRPGVAYYHTRQVFIGDVVNEWLTFYIDPPPGIWVEAPVPGLPELAAELRETGDEATYNEIVTRMWRIIDEELPYIAVADGSWLTGIRQALTNFQPQGIGTYMSFTTAELA